MSLTAQRLREVLRLDEATGRFVWVKPVGRRVRIGSIAGSSGAIGIDGTRYSEINLRHLWVHGAWPTETSQVPAAHVAKLPGEEWRPAPGFEGLYLVSSLGRVQSLGRTRVLASGGLRIFPAKLMKPKVSQVTGYLDIALQDAATKRMVFTTVHALVAEAFLPPRPEGAEVRHKDGTRSNAAASNLEWGQHVDNMRDQYRHGTRIASEWHPLAVLTSELVQWIRESSQKASTIARLLGCDPKTIYRARGQDARPTYLALKREDLAGLAPR